jgi:hypothetical protein
MLIPPLMVTFSGTLQTSAFAGALTGTWFLAQVTADPIASPLLEKMAREGGFFALVLVLLYFYRRDTKWATEFWKEQAALNTEYAKENAGIIKENTRSNVAVEQAVRENTVVMHAAKNVMATHLPQRRLEDGRDQ